MLMLPGLAVGAVLRQVQAKGGPFGVESDRRHQSTHSTYPASLSSSLTSEPLAPTSLSAATSCKQCLKYKTYSSIILNRFEALNLRLLTSMASPRERAVPTTTTTTTTATTVTSSGVELAESEGVKVEGETPTTTTTGKSSAGKKKKKGKK